MEPNLCLSDSESSTGSSSRSNSIHNNNVPPVRFRCSDCSRIFSTNQVLSQQHHIQTTQMNNLGGNLQQVMSQQRPQVLQPSLRASLGVTMLTRAPQSLSLNNSTARPRPHFVGLLHPPLPYHRYQPYMRQRNHYFSPSHDHDPSGRTMDFLSLMDSTHPANGGASIGTDAIDLDLKL